MNILSTRYFAHINLSVLMKSVSYMIDHVIGILSVLNKLDIGILVS